MKRLIAISIMVSGMLFASPAHAKMNIFACVPEWGALAHEIGGDKVSVDVATSAQQDVHYLRAKPGLLAKMRKADLVFCNGASLEVGWLPVLLRRAGGPDVQPGAPGHLMAADHVEMLGIPETVDRSMGDIHPEGNPHVHLNPYNILAVAKVLTSRLAQIDPENANHYRARFESFQSAWSQKISAWESQAQALKGMNVIVYHKSWVYLLNWLDIKAVAALEPKPGIPPTTGHLEEVLQAAKRQAVSAILLAPYENEKPARWLAERTDIPVIALPYTVGGNDNATTLNGLFEETIRLLKNANS